MRETLPVTLRHLSDYRSMLGFSHPVGIEGKSNPLPHRQIHQPSTLNLLSGEGLEGGNVAGLVAGGVDGGFGYEGAVGEARVVQKAAEGRRADGPLTDVLMSVELGAKGGLGVVAVPDLDGVDADGCADLLHGVGVASIGDDVVAGDMEVAGVEADGDGR